MNTQRTVQELATSVVFPPNAPAGWVLDSDHPSRADGSDAMKRAAASHAQMELRKFSARLFVEGIKDGLTPSESADVLIQDARYVKLREDYMGWCQRVSTGPNPTDPAKYFPPKLLLINRKLAEALKTGLRFENCLERTLARLPPAALKIPSSMSEGERARNHLWFASDPILPDCVIRGMLASHREYAMAATLDGLEAPGRWDLRSIHAAAVLWGLESRRYLTLIASIPGANVPTTLVPETERFNLPREFAEQSALFAQLNETAA